MNLEIHARTSYSFRGSGKEINQIYKTVTQPQARDPQIVRILLSVRGCQ